MIVTGVRHFGVESVEAAARFAAKCGHPLVTGFGIAGEERMGDFEDYMQGFRDRPRGRPGHHVHAGELRGWESVTGELDISSPRRIGHGVRAIENPDLVKRIADDGIVLECLSRFERRAQASFRQLRGASLPGAACQAGCKVTLSSDDPPYFWTSLKNEYDIAAKHSGMSDGR